ncbi:MAG: KUP/HAK/KT family potassium transporter [Magnetococcales bacterium]|nr:KUP/HAK/KT family potassium transporter [Magnetococcales bacterium]
MNQSTHSIVQKQPILPLIIGAVGVVFGDIGTSPLYAVKESIASIGHTPSHDEVLGVISLIFWSLVVVLTIKYQFFIMRADNKGEGGTLALVTKATQCAAEQPRTRKIILILGMVGVALFFGDGAITPAISILSAVEGLEIATPVLKPIIIPTTLAIIILLFISQRYGTGKIGAIFGPITALWFIAIAAVGISNIFDQPSILLALNPVYGIDFLLLQKSHALYVMGSVFLAVTGAEALYADMGHFGKKAINWGWVVLVFPSLTLSYFGQGALILAQPQAVQNPFYLGVPEAGLYPMVALATAATVIASQALISGAFSASLQAMQIGLLPRLNVIHTSNQAMGQIYVPSVNWTLLLAVVAVVLGFQNSSNLAAAYGIAVTGTMVIVTLIAFGVALPRLLGWGWFKSLSFMLLFLSIDLTFLTANITKIMEGGWFPLVLGGVIYFFLATWQKGQAIVAAAVRKSSIPLEPFLRQFETDRPVEGPGTAIYMTSNADRVPMPLVQLLRSSWTLHEKEVILTVQGQETPYVSDQERITVESLPCNFFRVTVRFGFMEAPDLSVALRSCQINGENLVLEESICYVGKPSFVAGSQTQMASWRMNLFLAMMRVSETASSFFKVPSEYVVEIGTRIVL